MINEYSLNLLQSEESVLDFITDNCSAGFGIFDIEQPEKIWLHNRQIKYLNSFGINGLEVVKSNLIKCFESLIAEREKLFDKFQKFHSLVLENLFTDQYYIECNYKRIVTSEKNDNRIIFTLIVKETKQESFSQNTEDFDFFDLFDIDEIQKLQDLFSEATNVASLITYPDGKPITKASNFSRLCKDIIRKTEIGNNNCMKSDAIIGAKNPHGFSICKCYSGGLWDAGVSIIVGDKHIANWLIGQVRNELVKNEDIISYADVIGVGRKEFESALAEVKVMSLEQFENVVKFLYLFSNQISEKAYQNYIKSKDILEIEKTGRALRESKERLTLLLKASKQGMYDHDLLNDTIFVNDEYASMLGYEKGTFTEYFDKFIERIHPSDKERYLRVYNNFINGIIKDFSIEFRLKSSSSDWIWINSLGKIVENGKDGKPLRIVGTLTNINEKRLIEEAIQINSQTMHDIITSIPSGLMIYQFQSPDKLYLIAGNPAGERLTGLNIKNNIGKEFNDIWKNAFKSGISEMFMQVVISGHNKEFEEVEYSDDEVSGVFRVRTFNMPGQKLGVAFENITKIKDVEKAIKVSEDRYKMIIENQNEYIVKTDSNGILQYVSPSYCELVCKTEDEIIGSSYFEMDYEEDIENAKSEIKNLTEPPHKCFFEQRILTDKGLKWLAWSDKAILNSSGKIDYIIGVGRDVTARKNAEFALHEKNRNAEFLTNIALKLSEITDSNEMIDFFNKELAKLCSSDFQVFSEYSPKKKALISKKFSAKNSYLSRAILLVGDRLNNLESPVDDNLYQKFIKEIVVKGSSFHEVSSGAISHTIDKTLRLVTGYSKFYGISYVISGELLGVTMIALKGDQADPPIELLKAFAHIAAVSLRRKIAEEKLRIISRGIDRSPAFVVITDSNGLIEYVNPYFCKVTGYEVESVIGLNPSILSSGMTPKYVYEELWKSIKSGKDWSGEFLNKKKSGELYWESALISPIFNENGEITNYIGIKQDITELKKMTADLIAAKVKAEESDNLKTAFLQNLSHEIRTPLNGIIGYTQLLQLNEVSNESRVNYSKIIHTSGKRLIDIVNNVLELSKIETGQSQVVPTNVNLNHIIDELYNFFLLQAQSKGLELIKDVPENSNENEIYTDESKLNQILINLIGNAIKFTEFGKVRYGFKFESDFVELFVIDTGIGIHDDFKDSVFDRFRQGDTHLSRDYEGAGLGLAICKGFVDLLGGKINFTSQKGIGTTFYFQIPRVLF